MTDFGVHMELSAWRCLNNPISGNGPPEATGEAECDFDMCEMCLRWALHCEKTQGSNFLHI